MRLGFNLEAKVPIFLGGTWIHGDNFPLGLMINISSILFRKEYQIKNLFELPFAGGFLPKPWNQFTKRQFFACKKILDPDSWCLLHVGPRDFYIWISWGAKVAGGGCVFEWIRETLEDPRSKLSFFQSSSFQTSNSNFETSTAHWLAFFLINPFIVSHAPTHPDFKNMHETGGFEKKAVPGDAVGSETGKFFEKSRLWWFGQPQDDGLLWPRICDVFLLCDFVFLERREAVGSL